MDVSVQGVLKARQIVYQHLRPTPLIEYPLLSQRLNCKAYIKHEHHHPTGAFKVRGGLNLIGRLTEEEKSKGVITATRGNHGQSIALASQRYGVRCVVAVPHGNNPEKNEAMRAFGAELLIHGRDFDEAREKVEEVQKENGMRYVHSGDEPLLIHGVGTYALEILEDLPDVDYIFVPIGGGSGAAAVLTVVRSMAPSVRVIGVQAVAAPAFFLSWKAGNPVGTETADTIADGLATRAVFGLPFSIVSEGIDDIICVTEEELGRAVCELFLTTHQVSEPAAAATLAAAAKIKGEFSGKKVVLVLTGCNITASLFSELLSKYPPENG